MTLRLFSSILVALALFLSPVAMSIGGSTAQAHAATVEMSGMTAHCDGLGQPPEKSQPHMKPGCAATCAAIPAHSPDAPAQSRPLKTRVVTAVPAPLAGITPEGTTPPPRFS